MKNLILVILLLSTFNCFAQSSEELQKKYTVFNRTISPGPEPKSIHLNDGEGEGHAWLNNTKFTNGTIEVDIKGKDVYQKSFVGIAFHGINDSTFEAVYFRPFNFRTTGPLRKLHAVQYIAPPKFGWEKLRNEFPLKYEQPITPAPDPNQWFHARITVDGNNIKVYVNGNTTPSLVVEPLVHYDGTMIGLWTDSDGEWKNVKITPSK
ncbi:MAG: DUF1080 domain-containing protein [Bacteroidetes bacterium]|jgi:hypothetical protein|nr:DUF1080 domain-containing protein [Bacteroidota bacterium]